MKPSRSFWILGSLCLAVTSSFTAVAQLGGCEYVYGQSTRNISSKAQNLASSRFTYNWMCESTGDVRDSSFSLDLDTVVDAIPLEFRVGTTDKKVIMKNFCKTGKEQDAFSASYSEVSDTVVIAALKNFNECRLLELKGFRVRHNEAPPSSVSITGENFKPGLVVMLTGIAFDPQRLTCRSTSLRPDPNPEIIIPKTFPRRTLKQVWSIICERRPENTREGAFYPRTTFQLTTSEGPYSFDLAANRLDSYATATDSKLRYQALVLERRKVKKALADSQAALAGSQAAYAGLEARLRNATVTYAASIVVMNSDNVVRNGVVYQQCDSRLPNEVAQAHVVAQCPNQPAGVFPKSSNGNGKCGEHYFIGWCLQK